MSTAPADRASGRTLVVWCPDWPVAAALQEADLPRHLPAAVFSANLVQASNAAAREFGIRRGMRRRDAQSRCPELLVLAADEARDARSFEEVLAALERLRPGVMPLRPGLVALRSPARFYGGEHEAGAVIAQCLVEHGVWDVRVGIADELLTAEQAARHAPLQETFTVAAGGSAAFLRDLPVDVLAEMGAADAAALLRRLGLHTLGALADLPGADVEARFGSQTAYVRRVVLGQGARPLAGRTPPPDLVQEVAFEPPLASAETVCFSAKRAAEAFVAGLGSRRLVCTEVVISVEAEDVLASERVWLHPRWFAAVDLIDRLHWQLVGVLAGSATGARGALRGGVGRVRFVPQAVAGEAVHADGLWGGTDARVERGIARVQGMLGHEAVVAPVLQGGRSPADRQAFVPWGDRVAVARDRSLPWPGSIPPPAPARVFAEPWEAAVLDAAGRPVVVLDRGGVSGEPARYRPGPGEPWQPVSAWAGPWPVVELWWEASGRRLARFQLVGVDGRAWLAACEEGRWMTEAAYD